MSATPPADDAPHAAQSVPLPLLLRRQQLDTVAGAFAYTGGTDMTVPNLGHRQRWSLRLVDDGGQTHVAYMKRYAREPLWWRLKRLLRYGPRKSPAGVEVANIHAAHRAGIATIEQAVGGEEFDARGARRSYIVMTAVPGEALEQSAAAFLESAAARPGQVRRFTALLADLVGRFHRAGFVHCDLYTAHVFLDESAGGVALRLIDLARMFRPRLRRFRWRVKDLAQLKYSMPEPWVRQEWEAFLDAYFGLALGPGPAASPGPGLAPGPAPGRCRRWVRGLYRRAIDRKTASIRRHDAKLTLRKQRAPT